MNRNELIQWLQSQQPTIERIILEAAQKFSLVYGTQPNFGFDLQCTQRESYNLAAGKDLCYDRYTTPFAYSLWYQARRINVFLSHFLDKIIEACNAGRPVEVFDLGAGTGCVQFCFGLAITAFKRTKGISPLISIINVDSSPFMLEYLQKYLWPIAIISYPELRSIPAKYNVYSWSNRGEFSVTNPWICASYLFDSTDNEEYLKSNFSELIEAFNPEKILLLSSHQKNKVRLMNSLSQTLNIKVYQTFNISTVTPIFKGLLLHVNAFRQDLISNYNLKASTYPVTWSDNSFMAQGLEKKQAGFSFDIRKLPDSLDIFNPPLKIRRDVELNEEQKKAAQFDTRPSIITGPAGCGKSIVMTEKIINILEYFQWKNPLTILVTTFNISLLKQLRGWITDLIESKGIQLRQHYYRQTNNNNDGTGKICTGDNFNIVIEFIHFEMLGKFVGQIKYLPFDENVHIKKLEIFISEVRQEMNIPNRNMINILTPSFLLEEYHRIIYGLQCRINLGEAAYLEVDRTGRGKGLDRNSQRPSVWKVLYKYTSWMAQDPNAGESFMARRQLLYNGLKDGSIAKKYDYVFVDEFQDCTRTDFEIMNLLLENTNNLILAGDMAQAVHIGKSGFIPKDEDSSRRTYYRLNGSYRLPFRICEAIFPLSEYLTQTSTNASVTSVITPYKGAPPGARPLIVYAENTDELAKKIVAIKNIYSVFQLNKVTILEKDDELCREVQKANIYVETTTILRLKGLEKEFIVWSLQADIEYEDEVMEFAYTIMTRTNCLLVVAFNDLYNPIYIPVLKYLSQDRLIFWDDETSKAFLNLKSRVGQEFARPNII
jgi:DNA helicase-2/ATP-dependent DNA helicase PcrA